MPSPPCLLSELGFAGLTRVELPVTCALVTGEPLLLLGTHGTAKSALARALSEALGLGFHAYDASKAMFEDIVGFPDPASLAQGAVRYVPTPLSLQGKGFVLVDELSRANPQLQNKWLEVVRSRALMGMEVPGLRHVFAAMNPLDYPGATPLDPALAGRFAWVVRMPEAVAMAPEDLQQVILTSGREDAPLAPAFRASTGRPGDVAQRLRTRVEAARARLPSVLARWDDVLVRYVSALAKALPRPSLDGRRLAMLRRNLVTAIAVRELDGAISAGAAMRTLVEEVVHASMPFRATGEPIDDVAVGIAHTSAWRASFDARGTDPVTRLVQAQTVEEVARDWPVLAPQMCEEDHDRVLARFHDRATAGPQDGRAAACVEMLALSRAVLAQADVFPAELVARMLHWYANASGLADGLPNGAPAALLGVRGIREGDPTAALAGRIAVTTLNADGDEASATLSRVRAGLPTPHAEA
jgi:MoxR-like ATPase